MNSCYYSCEDQHALMNLPNRRNTKARNLHLGTLNVATCTFHVVLSDYKSSRLRSRFGMVPVRTTLRQYLYGPVGRTLRQYLYGRRRTDTSPVSVGLLWRHGPVGRTLHDEETLEEDDLELLEENTGGAFSNKPTYASPS